MTPWVSSAGRAASLMAAFLTSPATRQGPAAGSSIGGFVTPRIQRQLPQRQPLARQPGRSYGTTRTNLAASTNYLLKYEYIPDVLEKRGPYREGHLGLAKRLIDEGKCLSGGPTGKPNMEVPTGALFIFTDEESAKLFVQEDPYVKNGIVTGHSIEEWNVVVQKE